MGVKSTSDVFMYLNKKFAICKGNRGTSACYVTSSERAPLNKCLISPGLRRHASQGQASIKDVSGLSMKTGRAEPLQIFTNGESQAVQCAMRSRRSLSSQKFTSAKPVIDICQRERGWSMSAPQAAGRRKKAAGSPKPEMVKEYGRRHLRHSVESLMHLLCFPLWL